MIRVPEIKLSLEEDEILLITKLSKKLKVSQESILSYRIFKKSVDAKKKNDIHFVYTLDVELMNEEKILATNSKKGVTRVAELSYEYEKIAHKNIERPIVVGTGPA